MDDAPMPNDDAMSEPHSTSTVRLSLRYASGLVIAHLITVAEVVAVVVSLSGQTVSGAHTLLTRDNLVLLVIVVLVGAIATTVAGYCNVVPSLRWYLAGVDPDPDQRRQAINLVRRETGILLGTWIASAAVLIFANRHVGVGPALMIGATAVFGGPSSISTSLLFTQKITRPVVAAASRDFIGRDTAPSVAARLVMMWVFNSAMPSIAIAVLILCRSNGWLIAQSASLDIPIIVLTTVSVFLGLRAMLLVSRSISDPVRDVVEAMSDVEHGDIGRTVDVYEQSEIGRLQSGFNRMVTGLVERDRLRDLFGRHVGPDVARLAVESDEAVAGEVRDVAILFIDLAGSTQLALNRSPTEVADVLNDFFRIVVAAVDQHGGLINKFQGDAALAVFGAPIKTEDAASAALAAARTLATDLRRLPDVDFGIGVSAGAVFAGNIGAENRYEYTVIGDPVNEASRLADCGKSVTGKTVASGTAIAMAACDEPQHWQPAGSVVLRGRSEPTQQWVPRGDNDHHV
jgi:class 3 adenylate cyclase